MTTRNIKGQRLSLLLSSCPLEYLIFLLYFSRVLITSYKTLISIITAKQLFLAFPLKNDASHTQHADYTHAPPHTHTQKESTAQVDRTSSHYTANNKVLSFRNLHLPTATACQMGRAAASALPSEWPPEVHFSAIDELGFRRLFSW